MQGERRRDLEQCLPEPVRESYLRKFEVAILVTGILIAGAGYYTATVDTLEEIVDHVAEANDGVQSISEAADDRAASNEEVVAMIDEVGSISEESASQAEKVAAAATDD